MRYLTTENPYLIGRFETGVSSTVSIYDLSDDSVVVDGAAMSEIGSTGYFKYKFDSSPTVITEYLYVMSTATYEHAGKIILGGYPDSLIEYTNNVYLDWGVGGDLTATLDNIDYTCGIVMKPWLEVLKDDWLDGGRLDLILDDTAIEANIETHVDNAITSNAIINDIDSSVTFIYDIEGGRWKRDGTTMEFFKADNSTSVCVFNLKKADGTAAGEDDDVYERVRT